MMQGDPKIDILMRPVRAAIERHVKGRAAVTDIYNRAYEAIMNSMDVIDTSAKVAAKQIAESAKNLQRAEKAEAENVRLQTELDAANEDAERLAHGITYRIFSSTPLCVHCGEGELGDKPDEIKHNKFCPITLHRERIGDK